MALWLYVQLLFLHPGPLYIFHSVLRSGASLADLVVPSTHETWQPTLPKPTIGHATVEKTRFSELIAKEG